MSPALKSRLFALDVITDVTLKNQPLEKAAARHGNTLEPQDKKLGMAIATVCIRLHGIFNHWVEQNTTQRMAEDDPVRFILHIGFAQLFCLDGIPDHAALDTTVNLAKEAGHPHKAKFVNAVLRSVQRAAPQAPELSASLSVPHWLKHILKKDYGRDANALLKAMTVEAPLTLRRRKDTPLSATQATAVDGFSEAFHWQSSLNELMAHEGWQNGSLLVQDTAAQLPAHILAKAYTTHASSGAVLDMCAAPGGKSIQLADLLPQDKHTAMDISPDRLKRVEENAKRCHVSLDFVCADGRKTPFDDGAFGAVLLDAPCTSTGTTRRNVDVFFTKRQSDIAPMVKLQKELLQEALRITRTGGVIVYATCSLLKDENERQIERFIKENSNLKRITIDPTWLEGELHPDEDGALRVLPTDGMDGFYVCALLKQA